MRDPPRRRGRDSAGSATPGLSSLAGIRGFRDHGPFVQDLEWGATVVVHDTHTAPRILGASGQLDRLGAVRRSTSTCSSTGASSRCST